MVSLQVIVGTATAFISVLSLTLILTLNKQDSGSNDDDGGVHVDDRIGADDSVPVTDDDYYIPPVNASTWVVESIPIGDFNLSLLPGEMYTADALISLVNDAEATIDISVMYWDLLANTSDDNFTKAELYQMGAQKGAELYHAFESAATRGVHLRFLQDGTYYPDELQYLLDNYPDTISARLWNSTAWYGGGIMHMKLWVVDNQHFYVGSANMDWLSLTQVKELGILVRDNVPMTADVSTYFNQWWQWGNPAIVPITSQYFNPQFQAYLTVPCFSTHLSSSDPKKCPNPLAGASTVVPANAQAQLTALLNDTSGKYFLTGSPFEIAVSPSTTASTSIRTWDADGLVYTIQDAKEFVYLSVMDFLPTAGYSGGYGDQPLWWSTLVDNLLVSATTKQIKVRMLISYWAHTNPHMVPYLKPLQENAQVCTWGSYYDLICNGTLEIRLFEIPGWDSTGAGKDWPSYSRVNHAKYIVTDRRANVGTSNMEWSYYYQTAGASFNTDHSLIRQGVQDVFERDWNSPYVYFLNGTAVNA